jgi:hypothetical protein
MLILVFVVSFGPKKGTILTYASYWSANFHNNLKMFISNLKYSGKVDWKRRTKFYMYHRFQFTIITSRPTIYLLFSFWCFFFFFGELLLLLTFNFNNLTDLIPSSYFVFIKTHVIFLTDNSSSYLNNIIFFYILFFTTNSLLFLLNLRYSFQYNYFSHQYLIDLTFILVNLYLFNVYFLIFFYTIVLINRLLITKEN